MVSTLTLHTSVVEMCQDFDLVGTIAYTDLSPAQQKRYHAVDLIDKNLRTNV